MIWLFAIAILFLIVFHRTFRIIAFWTVAVVLFVSFCILNSGCATHQDYECHAALQFQSPHASTQGSMEQQSQVICAPVAPKPKTVRVTAGSLA